MSPYIGGGFGGKLSSAPTVLAALGAKQRTGVKIALPRPVMFNQHHTWPATIQRIRIGAQQDGTITAIGHEAGRNLPDGSPTAVGRRDCPLCRNQRMTATRLACSICRKECDACTRRGAGPDGAEIAMERWREAGPRPDRIRIKNDTQVAPEKPERPFSQASCRMPAPRCGALSLEQAQPETASVREGDG